MSKFTRGMKTSIKNGAGLGLVTGAMLTGGSPLGTAASTVVGAGAAAVGHLMSYDAKAPEKKSVFQPDNRSTQFKNHKK